MKKTSTAVASLALVTGIILGGAGAAQAVDWHESSSYSTKAKCEAERKIFIQDGYKVMQCVQPPRTTDVVRWTFFWAR
ncbi:hypothetical protein [Microbacterium sp. K24]|uniref:hypothetical protein n=1 Tax=Microbacterium sp. K24 TaxID=2305446 RepID=UPI00109D102C|nr:hypothetical protein [Microbacterium sp. K24]